MTSTTFIIFGATGDLARRKLFPAIYNLVIDKKIDQFLIIGVSKDDATIQEVLTSAEQFIFNKDEVVWDTIKNSSHYYQLDISNQHEFEGLSSFIQKKEQGKKLSGNRILYCAVAADFFCNITSYSVQSGIIEKKEIDAEISHKIVYEKPFGYNSQSAYAINECIKKYLHEHQVFRIDHYLSKEIVSNIALVRFTNIVLEPLWNKKYIDQVHIVLAEDIGLEGRGWYYDRYGAIRDVVQNHALELLALIGMEQPTTLTGEYIRTKRAEVLKKVVFSDGIRGQYVGYKKEDGVAVDSKTETFALLRFMIENDRWAGVPFYITAGKALAKKETTIHIKFKDIECLLLRGCPTDSNWLTIQIAPEAIFLLTLNVKQPGRDITMVPVGMEFCHSCVFGPRTPEAYEILLEEILHGEQSISVRSDEIEYAWDVVDQIEKKKLPLYTYDIATGGPKEIKDFTKKYNIRWKQ